VSLCGILNKQKRGRPTMKTILIAEDDCDTANLYSMLLMTQGLHCPGNQFFSASGREGVYTQGSH